MVSFRAKLSAGLAARGIQISDDLADPSCDSVLVIGGTRQLVGLRRAQRRGLPIVQRMDGMNWLHRRTRNGARHWLRAELGNWLLATIRERLASRMVYQSHFVHDWWQRKYGPGPKRYRIIYNGVDLQVFNPNGEGSPPGDRIRILMVEGSLQGGYEIGLQSAAGLANGLQHELGRKVELVVAGQVDEKIKAKWAQQSKTEIAWAGVVPQTQIPALERSAHLLYSADLNAACPNAVIEALACGLPVLAFDTGALKELVTDQAGRVVPYGGDPWMLDKPDISNLVRGAVELVQNQAAFRQGARERAEQAFGLDPMVEAYIQVLGGEGG